jgi:hypothetical protein
MSPDQIANLVKRVAQLEQRLSILESHVSEIKADRPRPSRSNIGGRKDDSPLPPPDQIEPAVIKKRDGPVPLSKEVPRLLGEQPEAHKESSKHKD